MTMPQNKWVLTETAWAKLMARLDPEAAHVGEAYEALRESLVKFLDWRGASSPEELVDETFNRVARKLEEGEAIQDVPSFCHGIARLVYLQSLERHKQRHVALDEALPLPVPSPEIDHDVRRECLARCLQTLTPGNRELITTYYRDERRQKIDNRAALAERLGIPLNALRNRAQRIRDKLEQCIRRCCQNFSAT